VFSINSLRKKRLKTKILVIGDTHISSFKDLPMKILQLIKESDWIIHVGDYTTEDIVKGFNQLKALYLDKNFHINTFLTPAMMSG